MHVIHAFTLSRIHACMNKTSMFACIHCLHKYMHTRIFNDLSLIHYSPFSVYLPRLPPYSPNVIDCRIDITKKTLWVFVHQMLVEDMRSLRPSVLMLATWLVQRGKHVPHHSWATSAYGPCSSEAAKALFLAIAFPKEFTRQDAYILFFSGKQRDSIMMIEWDHVDARFLDMTFDNVKAYAERVHILSVVGERENSILADIDHVEAEVGENSSDDDDDPPPPPPPVLGATLSPHRFDMNDSDSDIDPYGDNGPHPRGKRSSSSRIAFAEGPPVLRHSSAGSNGGGSSGAGGWSQFRWLQRRRACRRRQRVGL